VAVLVVLVRRHCHAVRAAVRRAVDDEISSAIKEETGPAAVPILACKKGPFNAAFKPEVQERAWRDGGVYPFLRIPEALMKRAELLAAKRADATGGCGGHARGRARHGRGDGAELGPADGGVSCGQHLQGHHPGRPRRPRRLRNHVRHAGGKKEIKLADFKAQADRLYPDGITAPAAAVAPLPPAAVAPLPRGGGAAAPRGATAAGWGPGRRLGRGSGNGRGGAKQHIGQRKNDAPWKQGGIAPLLLRQ